MASNNLWGIHAGRTGDADALFLKHNCIALGWAEMGNLSQIPADREAFRSKYQAAIRWPSQAASPPQQASRSASCTR